jgi:myo-inositol-1(or 4)-monophosphatase
VIAPSADELARLRELARSLAREAGDLVQRDRPARVQVAATKSSPTDVVTEKDRAAEQLIRSRLAVERPDDGMLGEEAGLQSGGSGLTWVVDPIDGTTNYLYGIPFYAVSVAVVTGDPERPGEWSSVAGCVHNPATGHTWSAALGLGADLDGVTLLAPAPPQLGQALVGTGFGYRPQRRQGQARVAAELLPRLRDLRRIGSAAIDLCMVATGWLDAFYERGLNPWDLAAGALVATESGAVVRGLGTDPPSDRMLVAARRPLVDVLAAELDRLDAAAAD